MTELALSDEEKPPPHRLPAPRSGGDEGCYLPPLAPPEPVGVLVIVPLPVLPVVVPVLAVVPVLRDCISMPRPFIVPPRHVCNPEGWNPPSPPKPRAIAGPQ